jgi:error-prone DNA polymerase
MLPGYVELHCRSNFSFLDGASHPEELVARAADLGYSGLAITDECSMAGIVRAHAEAQRLGFSLIVGSSFVLDGDAAFELVVLCQTREGYGNLCEMITLARSRAAKGQYRIERGDFSMPASPAAHLQGLPECLVILQPAPGVARQVLQEQAAWAHGVFGSRLWLGLTLLYQPLDVAHRAVVQEVAGQLGIPVVATGNVRMHLRSRKPLQDTLTAIRLGRTVGECGFELASNAEQHLRSRSRLAALYPPQTLAQSTYIASLCRFSLNELRYEYPDEIVPVGETPASHLRRQTFQGLAWRFPAGVPRTLLKAIVSELELIAEMEYEAYFLTVYDLVRFARSRGILCQGRGSAANSVVCYCLGITAADPRETVPLFERFISRERNEPPDIDVDFEHQRREEVIQYIYGRYGRDRAALAAVVSTYRSRSSLRDTGRALGIGDGLVDAVARGRQWWDGRQGLLQRFVDSGLDADSPTAAMWAHLAEQLIGFPRHLSQHPGGFVIARERLSRMVPIENAAMPGRSVIQWDKDDLDALGLLKVDVLALGMLSVLRRALDIVAWQRGEPFELHQIPPDCEQTYAMIRRADTVGTFQIESRAQMSMLPRLKPRCYYDLVVQVAIVRPGPIQGGMVRPYLRRRQGLEPEGMTRPELKAALGRTLGVPIFQEQVMQVAMIAADFTPGQADSLRRSMAAWRRKGGVSRFRESIIQGMLQNGYDQAFAESIFRQMEGFGEYGFPEAHAASFALLAYDSAWLKRHYPEAFLAALLNSQPMGFYSPAQLVQDAMRHGVRVLPADVSHSDWEARVMQLYPEGSGFGVRLGLNQIRGLSHDTGRRIEAARTQRPFASLADLAQRARPDRSEIEALAAADALRSLAGDRRQAAWTAATATAQQDLLQQADVSEQSPRLARPSEAQDIVADYRSLGLTLRRHPLALLRDHLATLRYRTVQALGGLDDGRRVRACGLVVGRQRPGTANGTVFVTLEDETGSLNVIVWPQLVERQRRELLGSRLMGVYGVWQNEGGVRHLVAHRLFDLSELLGGLHIRSRDFH